MIRVYKWNSSKGYDDVFKITSMMFYSNYYMFYELLLPIECQIMRVLQAVWDDFTSVLSKTITINLFYKCKTHKTLESLRELLQLLRLRDDWFFNCIYILHSYHCLTAVPDLEWYFIIILFDFKEYVLTNNFIFIKFIYSINKCYLELIEAFNCVMHHYYYLHSGILCLQVVLTVSQCQWVP